MEDLNKSPDIDKQPRGKSFRGRNIADSINSSPSTIMINIIIEGLSTVILYIGLFFIIRFMFMAQLSFGRVQFKIVLGLMVLFCLGWTWNTVRKIRIQYREFKKNIELNKNKRAS